MWGPNIRFEQCEANAKFQPLLYSTLELIAIFMLGTVFKVSIFNVGRFFLLSQKNIGRWTRGKVILSHCAGFASKLLSLKSLSACSGWSCEGEIQIEIHPKFSNSDLLSHLHFPLRGSDLSKANETWKNVKAAKRQHHGFLWAVHHWFSVFIVFFPLKKRMPSSWPLLVLAWLFPTWLFGIIIISSSL